MSSNKKKSRRSPHRNSRREAWPTPIEFSESLPISVRREEIAEAIRNNQVVIIAGETGSGKTTQIPKICLSLGYGENGLIGHTQPRRIAARTVASRIAAELKTPLGEGVGYQVRFTDNSSKNTRIKLMTDGVLLAEIQHDRLLRKYDVIIIDEAHERSLNIDFLLGLLKPLCLQRPELKVIVTSATIDLQKFSQHFTLGKKAAPIIEVSGRTYPVETIYQPIDEAVQLPEKICETVKTIIRDEAKGKHKTSGDILVFCAGEREIRETAQTLKRSNQEIEVLPLYSRLSVSEQNKIFRPAHRRKVVLATNVAETSITVPGIAYVIDPGLARISRYSFRSKIQRLPIEPISQASANQRKGRCGRVSNGVCIRLYSEQEFEQRAEFTPAEILRSNLASVILKMLRLEIKNINQFEFLDKPDKRLLNDGYKLLQELGAIDDKNALTLIGRSMSDLPVDPKYARIIVAANEVGCLRDALVLISGLSIQDPRERPADKQMAADQAHAKLHHPYSDFFSYLCLWQAVSSAKNDLSNAKFKQKCLDNYWSIARVFEWRELFRQILTQCKAMGYKVDQWQAIDLDALKPTNTKQKQAQARHFDSRYELLHKSVLSGLISNFASKDVDDAYLGTRSRKLQLFPGSAQAKRKPKWIIAGEYIETSRLFAHTIGEIKPQWLIDSAPHLCRYSYSDPHYHVRSGSVKAYRKTLLYGVTLKDKERINYAPINAKESRQTFIQQALVEARYKPRSNHKTHAPSIKSSKLDFVAHNTSLIEQIEKQEVQSRRRNLLVDDQRIYDFFDQRIPQHVNSRAALEKWLSKGNQELLKLDSDSLLQAELEENHEAMFPDSLSVLGKNLALQYKFDPGKRADGVTLVVPVSVLSPLPDHIADWLVPGLLREKCVALIKTLPKAIRKNFAPASDAIHRVYANLTARDQPLNEVLADQLFRSRGIKVNSDDFDSTKLDDFYRMNFRIIDTDGSLIEEGRDLARLKLNYANAVEHSVHAHNAKDRLKLERHNIERWDFGELRENVEYRHEGMTVQAFLMLKTQDDNSISLMVHDKAAIAKYHTHHAIINLAKTVLTSTTHRQSFKYLQKELMSQKQGRSSNKGNGLNSLAQQLKSTAIGKTDESAWIEPLISCGLSSACFHNFPNKIRKQSQFSDALELGNRQWVATTLEIESALIAALQIRDTVLNITKGISPNSIKIDIELEDIKAQIYRLFEPSFLSYTPINTLKQYPRYLRAIEFRLEKISSGRAQSSAELGLATMQKNFDRKITQLSEPNLPLDFVFLSFPEMQTFSRMLEEWRVSIFAQHLKTQIPVSEKRLEKLWNTQIKTLDSAKAF